MSRADIDAGRIGCSGTSGGGTQTSYLMVVEPRIVCAVPCCYLTSLERLIDTIGPQDAEQQFPNQLVAGLNHADFAIAMAPRPLLFGTATRDFFDIAGSWDSFRQAKRIYTRLGVPEQVDIVEADLEHNWATELRVPMVRWMRRWLCGVHEPVTEADAAILPEESLYCTPKGQVGWLDGAKSAFDLNVEAEGEMAAGRRQFWRETPREEALAAVRRLVGVRRMDELPALRLEMVSSQDRDSFSVCEVRVGVEPGLVLPGLLFRPKEQVVGACLYLDGAGIDGYAAEPGPVDRLVAGGNILLSVDLPGIGRMRGTSTGGRSEEFFGRNSKEIFLAYMLGKSYVGMRTEIALACGRLLSRGLDDAAPCPVRLVGVGKAGVAALHAAALESELFCSVEICRSLATWTDVLRTPLHRNQLINVVHGALKIYDLPDLAGSLPDAKVKIVEPVDAAGRPV